MGKSKTLAISTRGMGSAWKYETILIGAASAIIRSVDGVNWFLIAMSTKGDCNEQDRADLAEHISRKI